MIAKSFLETIQNEQLRLMQHEKPSPKAFKKFWENVIALQRFYSQSFSVDMLANPLEFTEYEGWAGTEKGFNKATDKWLKAEDKVLFEVGYQYRNVPCDIDANISALLNILVKRWTGAPLDLFLAATSYKAIEFHWKPLIIDKYFKQ